MDNCNFAVARAIGLDRQESMRTIHGTVAEFKSVAGQINCNRYVSLGSAQTRKTPNAFMFCRQIDVMRRAGTDRSGFSVHQLQ